MKTLLCVCLCVGVSACGPGYSWGSCEGDFMVGNVCTYTNGFDVDSDRVQGIVENTLQKSIAFAGGQKKVDEFQANTIVYLSFVENSKELKYYGADGLTIVKYNKQVQGPNDDHVVSVRVLVEYWAKFYDECLEESPTAHEFLHVAIYAIKGLEWFKNSPEHPADWFGEGTIEETVHSDYACQMCGDCEET